MTEAAARCVRFAFARVGVHRIRCAAATGNQPKPGRDRSPRLQAGRCARQAEFVASRWVDHAVFSRLSTD
jgi:RimJ/RimL family protein N-acetyltransferase